MNSTQSPIPTLQPPASLIMGASGSGKSTALVTYILAGIETFVLCTEPGGPEALIDACKLHKADINKLHWMTCLPSTTGIDGLKDLVSKISSMDFEAISKQKHGFGKDEARPAAMAVLDALLDFKCERTGKSYGSMFDWGNDRHFAFDSLSGLSVIAWKLTVGQKPTAHQGEWSIAMNFISDLLMKITADRSCYFTLTAHVEKEQNEITGVNQVMVSTLGRKLAPKIPRFFSEVIYAQRAKDAPQFRWSTLDNSAELKNRGLPVGDKLLPNFVPLVDSYRQRLKTIAATPQAATATPAA